LILTEVKEVLARSLKIPGLEAKFDFDPFPSLETRQHLQSILIVMIQMAGVKGLKLSCFSDKCQRNKNRREEVG